MYTMLYRNWSRLVKLNVEYRVDICEEPECLVNLKVLLGLGPACSWLLP